jgi:flagellar assembly protein FliH
MADIEQAARRVLLRAQHQAEQLLAAAQAEAEQLKSAASAQGREIGHREGQAVGLEEGRRTGHQQALDESRAQLQRAFAALSSAAQEVDARRIELETAALQDVVKLAVAIARRVVKRQGMIDPQVLAANLEEAMKRVASHSDLRIAIHPEQRAALDAALPRLSLTWPALRHVEIVQESTLSPGGCRVFTRDGQIDATLEAQLDLIVADLLPAPPETAP